MVGVDPDDSTDAVTACDGFDATPRALEVDTDAVLNSGFFISYDLIKTSPYSSNFEASASVTQEP